MQPTALTSREECEHIRGRMRLRPTPGGDRTCDAEPDPLAAARLPVVHASPVEPPLVQAPPLGVPMAGPVPLTPQVPAMLAEEPAPSALATFQQCRSLRERVYDRAMRPQSTGAVSGSHPGPVQYPTVGPVKDTYPHEQPFPVDTVFELAGAPRPETEVPAGPTTDGHTLLLPREAAVVVKSLEQSLDEAKKRAEANEARVAELEKELAASKATAEAKEKDAADAETRRAELAGQLEKQRAEATDAAAAAQAAKDAAAAAATTEANDKTSAEVAKAKEDLTAMTTARDGLASDKQALEAVVMEMREQLCKNSQVLQNHTLTIRNLTDQLLAAKNQAAAMARGVQEREKLMTQQQTEAHKASTQIKALEGVQAQLSQESAIRQALEAEVIELRKAGEALRSAAVERDHLAKVNKAQEEDIRSKATELTDLRHQIELIKAQTGAAFQNTSRFLKADGTSAAASAAEAQGAMYAAASGAVPAPSANAALLRQLQLDVEQEDKRTADEARRWRHAAVGL